MGIPKFFRFMSERYPLISLSVKNNRIPEFDNLYLDMNGIIHNCSHPNDTSATFRVTEEKIFVDTFAYISHIFNVIKPTKVFFLAVDGVAPRAKMNQQRSRRFRTAKEMKDLIDEAKRKGEEIPEGDGFDSNCITPGTPFMARLSEQLKYFLAKKVSEDAEWRNVKVIFSGHDVPGEGEHKIMEYIRSQRAHEDYTPNVRHCLYGLDADLIMLGLLSHDPHFSLLREEVTFGPSRSTNKVKSAEEQNFYLLHLSLFREYLDLEFQDIKKPGVLPFDYDLEKIIDDYILLNIFVGNDFLPHLPSLHINTGAISDLIKIYKSILPKAGGYLNENGKVNIPRLMLLLSELNSIEMKYFKDEILLAKTSKKHGGKNKPRKVVEEVDDEDDDASIISEAELLQELSQPVKATTSPEDSSDYKDEEARIEQAEKSEFEKKLDVWKSTYYHDKLEFSVGDEDSIKEVARKYIEGIQWVLFYYYTGVKSWGWFYNYHYAPMVSDFAKLTLADLTFTFELGKPFKPFEQLMGVLPALSSVHVPPAFRSLMTDTTSPIFDFYPLNFEQDKNGKKAAWEAVVKVPFLDEKRLLAAMDTRKSMLTDEEKKRNLLGSPWLFAYDGTKDYTFHTTLPQFFRDIPHCHADVSEFEIEKNPRHLRSGLVPGVRLGRDTLPGFPSLYYLDFKAKIAKHKVNVFRSESANDTVVITLDQQAQDIAAFVQRAASARVYVQYPHLQEARVVSVVDKDHIYHLDGRIEPNKDDQFQRTADVLSAVYSKRYGCVIGKVTAVVKAQLARGVKQVDDGAFVKDYEDEIKDFALQTIVFDAPEDSRTKERPPVSVEKVYPLGSNVFLLSRKYFGALGQVVGHHKQNVDLRVVYHMKDRAELSALRKVITTVPAQEYIHNGAIARSLKMSSLALSRLTASVFVSDPRSNSSRGTNVGLNLKFEARGLKVLDYSRKTGTGWEFSRKAVAMIQEYVQTFPEVVEALKLSSNIPLTVANVFGRGPGADARFDALKKWLKAQDIYNLESVPLFVEQLTAQSVKAMEAEVEKFKKLKANEDITQVVLGDVPRREIASSANISAQLNYQNFQLGDRVMMVSDTGAVPVAAKGFVAGLQAELIDVVFDVEFIGGTTLGNRCRPFCGQTVLPNTILNITNPSIVAGVKGLPQKPLQMHNAAHGPASNGRHTVKP